MGIILGGNTFGATDFNPSGEAASPALVTRDLVLWVDAGNNASYANTSNYYDCGYGCQYYSSNPGCTNCNTQWKDMSGYGTDGTLVNGTGIDYSTGGGSMFFDGSNDYVTFPNTNLTHGTKNWTYSAWINFSSTPSLGTIFENGSWTSCLLIRFETNGITIYSMGSYWGKFTLNPTLDTWYKVDFVRNGNTVFYFFNGVSTASLGFSANISPSSNLYIGMSQHSAGQCFHGRIGQAQIYSRALSDAEILQNFNNGRMRYGV